MVPLGSFTTDRIRLAEDSDGQPSGNLLRSYNLSPSFGWFNRKEIMALTPSTVTVEAPLDRRTSLGRVVDYSVDVQVSLGTHASMMQKVQVVACPSTRKGWRDRNPLDRLQQYCAAA